MQLPHPLMDLGRTSTGGDGLVNLGVALTLKSHVALHWGADSYNWGAGMARVDAAAAFIRANMPLGQPNRLSEQQAWDVAAFIDSRERPRDPRQGARTVEETAQRYHAGEETFYGRRMNDRLIGVGTPVPAR